MFKYILKRLGLAIIVLLGVSVIIYFLVRLMPANYLETKFSAQLQQGTITHDQLDEFKKRYGLYMPDAYLDINVDGLSATDGTNYSGNYSKDAKERNYKDATEGLITYNEFYAGTYHLDSNEAICLELKDDGTFRLLDKSGEESKVLKSGLFVASADSIKR